MKKYILPLILILLLTFTLIGNCAWLSGWDYRIECAIGDYAGDIGASVTWFPVTVFLTSTQGEEVFVELTTDAEYLKVAFTKADGTTELYGECELFAHYTSQYPPAQSDTYVKSTTKWSTNYWAYYATTPTKPLTGESPATSWASTQDVVANQRFHIDLGSAKVIEIIYYENFHSDGSVTDGGVQNFTFWGSNTGAGTFDDLVYANDGGWTELTVSQNTFDRHSAVNEADPKYIIVTNSTAYRYYAFKFADNYGGINYMGVRRIELQIKDPKAIYHISRDGWTINANTSIYMYYDKDHADNTTYIGAITARTEVWDGNFKFVCHMVDDTASTVKDSTSNNNDGTKTAANEPIEATCKVGQGQDFDAADEITVADADSLDGMATLTHEVWSKADALNDAHMFRKENMYSFSIDVVGKLKAAVSPEWAWFVSAYVLSTVAYEHIVWTWDGAELKLYVNGSLEYTGDPTNGAIGTNAENLIMGNSYDGQMDEHRFSNTLRSTAWIKGAYNSTNDTLLTYGSEKTEVEVNAVWFGTNF